MATTLLGPYWWGGGFDAEGYREYKVRYKVRGVRQIDGPANVLRTAGLPIVGAPYALFSDLDIWAWCRPESEARLLQEKESLQYWSVEKTFSNKPQPHNQQRCHDIEIEDPLLEPQKLSGSFVRSLVEATHDLYGNAITNSAHEQIRGPQVEFDASLPTVRIEQNVADLQLPLITSMRDTVNAFPLWGMPPRTVKLAAIDWDKKYYGQCSVYYTRRFEFEVNPDTFDRFILDEGTKVINGRWSDAGNWVLVNIDGAAPDPNNPAHFIRYKDRNGENARVILDGAGKPYNPDPPAGTAAADVTPVTTCNDAVQLQLGGTYGADDRYELSPSETHYYKIRAGAERTIIIRCNEASDPPQFNTTDTDPKQGPIGVVIYNDACSQLWDSHADDATASYNAYRVGFFLRITVTVSAEFLRFAVVNHAAGNQLEYQVEIGEDPSSTNQPGEIFVPYYGESDFLQLGIPAILV